MIQRRYTLVSDKIFQKKKKSTKQKSSKKQSSKPIGVGICVLKNSRNGTLPITESSQLPKLVFTNQEEVSRTVHLTRDNGPYCIIPCSFKPVANSVGFILSLYSETLLDVQKVESPVKKSKATKKRGAKKKGTTHNRKAINFDRAHETQMDLCDSYANL
eukprot:535784_1